MDNKKDIFFTNPDKAHSRITINSFMMGSLFFILTLVWSLNPSKFSFWIFAQIVMAIPLLYVSSLAYSKVSYWKEVRLWDMLGWFTNNTGNIFILNIVGLMTGSLYIKLALVYFGLIIILMFTYSVINLIYKPSDLKEKLFKFFYFLLILIAGGILPLVLHK